MGSYSPQPPHQREDFHAVPTSVATPSPESNWQHNNDLSPHSNTSSSGVSSSSTVVNGSSSHIQAMNSHLHPALQHSPHGHHHHHHHPAHLHSPYHGLQPSSGRDLLNGMTHLSPIPGQMLSPHHILNHTGDGKPVIQAAQLAGKSGINNCLQQFSDDFVFA